MKYLRWMALSLASFIVALWLGSCSSPPTQVVALNFGAAGMVRGALEELDTVYQQKRPNVVLNLVFAGSGTLQGAIEQGEAFDGVLFADIAPLDRLQKQGLIVPASRKELVTTDMVLIARANSPVQVADFRELGSDRIQTVAMGSQDLAIGRYTDTILTRLGIARTVQSKAVLAKVDVREVLRAIEDEEAEVGITYLSEAKTSDKVKVLATASQDLYEPIRSGVAQIKTSAHPQEMQAYLDFLSSKRAMAIFQKFGLYSLQSEGRR